MPSTQTDVIDGVSTSTAVKAPVRCATTANIALNGEQTIDGVAVVAGDRVLVKNQSNAVENGIYNASGSTWTRAADWDGSRDVVSGTLVPVFSYTQNAILYRVTTTGAVRPGTTAVTFVAADADSILRSDLATNSAGRGADLVAFRSTNLGATPRTVQSAISDLGVNVLNENSDANNGVTSANAAILAAISTRPAGKNVFLPAGDYLITGTLLVTLTSDLAIIMEAGARIVGDASGTVMLDIRGGAGTPTYSFELHGGQIDNGDRPFAGGVQSGSALHIEDMKSFYISGTIFGRETRAYADDFGDSGLETVRCSNGTVTGCSFYGQPDLGIYLSGGASTGSSDDYGDVVISGNHFVNCQTAFSAKRANDRVVFDGNTVVDCSGGATVFEAVSGANTLRPAESCVVSNNIFKRTEGSAIRLHGAGGHSVTGNLIEDFGFTGGVSNAGQGIWLRGCRECSVSGNLIRFKDWVTDSNHTAIKVEPYTSVAPTPVVYTPGANSVYGNTVSDVYRAIQEITSDPNAFVSNVIRGSTVILAAGINAGTFISFWDESGVQAFREFFGNVEVCRRDVEALFSLKLRTFSSAIGITDMRSDSQAYTFGNIPANTAVAHAFTVAGITAEHLVSANPDTEYSGIVFTAVASTDTIKVWATNATTALIAVGSITFSLKGIRIE